MAQPVWPTPESMLVTDFYRPLERTGPRPHWWLRDDRWRVSDRNGAGPWHRRVAYISRHRWAMQDARWETQNRPGLLAGQLGRVVNCGLASQLACVCAHRSGAASCGREATPVLAGDFLSFGLSQDLQPGHADASNSGGLESAVHPALVESLAWPNHAMQDPLGSWAHMAIPGPWS